VAPIPPSFGYNPLFFGSAVLPDGRVIVEGGEYNFSSLTTCSATYGGNTNCGAIYDPVADSWTAVPPPSFGDTRAPNGIAWCVISEPPSVILPDGSFMIGDGGYLGNSN
jgi:hypothetical protein